MANAHMPARARAAVSALVLLMSTACSVAAWANPADYVLGPQDKLRIKVYDWRNSTGEAHEWTALTGEFSVGASGRIDLPLAALQQRLSTAVDISSRQRGPIAVANRPTPAGVSPWPTPGCWRVRFEPPSRLKVSRCESRADPSLGGLGVVSSPSLLTSRC